MDIIEHIINVSTSYITNGGIIVGFLLVLLESFLPFLPLSVFVALIVNSFGFLEGVIISWIATSIGSFFCYWISFFIDKNFISKILKNKAIMFDNFNKISFTSLVLIITLPFTPSFLINVLAGFSKMPFPKFFFSVIIGKCFSIIFWGYIGKSVIDNIFNIYSLIYISIALVLAYIISKIINKKLQIE